MMIWFKKFLFSLFLNISMALKRIDDDLRADPIDLFKTEQRMELRSLLSKFAAGVADEQYKQYFYEVLKKADKFLRTSNPAKIRQAAAKHGLDNYGAKDEFGRRFEHYGFFDEAHKYAGKTLKEVRGLEVAEKTLIDEDDYPVVVMYQNKKEFSFLESASIILSNDKGLYAPEIHELARMKKYPLTIVRDGEVANRIEQLTEYVHVKQISSEHKILEFYIPSKFGIETISEDDPIFKELINIRQVWFKDEYGDRNAYSITGFRKRTDYKKFIETGEINPSGFDIIKFNATDIIEIKVN